MAKKKYYVVWKGVEPGVYASWKDCQAQIKGYAGALYKSFDSEDEARQAAASSPYIYIGKQAEARKAVAKSIPDSVSR